MLYDVTHMLGTLTVHWPWLPSSLMTWCVCLHLVLSFGLFPGVFISITCRLLVSCRLSPPLSFFLSFSPALLQTFSPSLLQTLYPCSFLTLPFFLFVLLIFPLFFPLTFPSFRLLPPTPYSYPFKCSPYPLFGVSPSHLVFKRLIV